MSRQQLYDNVQKSVVTVSIAVPFVNRREELRELRDGLESEEGEFYTVVGPSGSGKSALLDQFQEQCEDDQTYTVRHDLGEPKSGAAFIYRFLESWDEALPNSRWDSIKEHVRDTNTEPFVQATKLADPAVGAGARIINAAISGTLEDEKLNNATDEVDFLVNVLQDSPDEKIAVIIDQFDERRLSETACEELDRFFRELSKQLPTNIVWCIGADHKFGKYESTMNYLQVGALNSDAIEDLINKAGSNIGEVEADSNFEDEDVVSYVTEITNFDSPDLTKKGLIDEIKTRTMGDPFVLALFLQIAHNEDLSRAIQDLPMRRRKVRRHLEERMLDRMQPDAERLMRDVCVLEQFDANLAAQVSGNTVSEARQILSDLRQQSLLREVKGVTEKTTYRAHDLIREFLQDEITGPRERQNRYRAIAVYSSRVYERVGGRRTETVNPEVETYCENIRLHFNKVLTSEEANSAANSVYTACDSLDYIRQADVESGLRYCYSIQDSESLPQKIKSVSSSPKSE